MNQSRLGWDDSLLLLMRGMSFRNTLGFRDVVNHNTWLPILRYPLINTESDGSDIALSRCKRKKAEGY